MPVSLRFSVFFMLLMPFLGSAQRDIVQEELAGHYIETREWDKATVYLERLYEKQADRWYTTYYRALLELKDYDAAEKLVKKHLRSRRHSAHLYVHLGHVYGLGGDEKKEKEAYERALKELVPMQPYLQQLATAFSELRLFDYALEVYGRGAKASPDNRYHYEKAELYRSKGDISAMIGEYLDALESRPSELPTVQTSLSNSLGYDDEQGGMKNPVLKLELLKRINKDPSNTVLVEFLIFIQKQQKDFDGAFVQARALDKRLREEGSRIYDLARLCVENGQWETARRCYDYLLDKGKGSMYYDVATIEGLHVEYLALTRKAQPPLPELQALETKLQQAYDKYKSLSPSYQLLKNLVNLQAFYLGKATEAIGALVHFNEQPGLDPLLKAEFKLLLGDLYLVNGAIWDASLMYSQVEKDFKYETIGQEAKFRNAKLSFYAGDFAWAKTQCDVLKGATSKLIANDALDLSLVISDAIGVDTNAAPLSMFSAAELLALQHRYAEAIGRLDSINLQFSEHTLGDDISYKKAGIYVTLGKYSDAEAMYRHILEYYPGDLYGDDAQFRLAELYHRHILDDARAREAYEGVLLRYPGSIYSVEARKRFRELRGDNLNN